MSRWTPITDDDPLRVDLDQLDQHANKYKRASREAGHAAHTLKSVSDVDHWDTDTAKAFRERAGTLARELSEVSEGMNAASDAVQRFIAEIEDCERRAERVTEEAREKQAEIRAADAEADHHRNKTPATPEEEDEHKQELWVKDRRCYELRAELAEIERRFYRIVNDADQAANEAAQRMRAAASFAPELSWWDKTKHTFSEIYDDYIEPTMDDLNSYMNRVSGPLQKWCQEQTWWNGTVSLINGLGSVAAIVGCVAAVVLVAALLIGAFVVTGPVLAAITTIAAVALTVCAAISLAANVVNALDGDKSRWSAAGMDLAGLATLGLGKATSNIGRLGMDRVLKGTAPHAPQYRPRKGMQFLSQLRYGDREAAETAHMIKRVRSITSRSGGVPPELRREVARATAASRIQTGLAWGDHGRKSLDFIHSEKQLSRENRHVSDRSATQHFDQTRRVFELAAPFAAKGKPILLKDTLSKLPKD